ncbi:MAG: ArsR/SmtB family transcription factor [Thermoplasmatota archaeon]
MNQQAAVLDDCFAALADPTRRAMLQRLAAGDATVSELAQPFEVSLPAILKHLKVLESAGLVTTNKVGRSRTVTLHADPLQEATAWMTQYRHFWDDRLDALVDLLERGDSPAPDDPPQEERP